MATRDFACFRDNTSRTNSKKGQGTSHLLMSGRDLSGNVHRIYMHFTQNWGSVQQINKAELVLTTTSGVNFEHGTTPKISLGRLETTFSEGAAGHGEWETADYVNIVALRTNIPTSYDVNRTNNTTQTFDITPLIEQIAPKTVRDHNGAACLGKPFTGIRVWAPDETKNTQRVEWNGRTAATPAHRPVIRITYNEGAPPAAPEDGGGGGKLPPYAPTLLAPIGAYELGEDGGFFTGEFTSPVVGDVLNSTEVRVWDATESTLLWSQVAPASADSVAAAAFSVPFPASLRSGRDYKWDARVSDQTGTWSPYTAKTSFSISNTPPVVSQFGSGQTVDTLKGFLFQGGYSDADSDALRAIRLQFRTDTSPSNPDWADDLIWDSDVCAPATPGWVAMEYGGPSLAAGTYAYRLMAVDARGGESAWSYGTVILSANYENGEPTGDFMTGYNRANRNYRIVLYAVNTDAYNINVPGTGRGRGDITGVITDAANVGASIFANSPGEFFFTLPAEHPQISECEPYRTHYSLQMYIGDSWVEKYTGLLTDFDATEDEVVFYGIDYLGLLGNSADERFDATKPDLSYTNGGSKYTNVPIRDIIGDQIDHGRGQTDSTYAFITRPTSTTYWASEFSEAASLVTTFNPTLSTVTGLIDSHKQGRTVRSRLWVERTAGGAYRWRLTDNYGKDRENIRLEYGGILNGFRLVGFGDFATMAHGIGRVIDTTKTLYEKAESPIISDEGSAAHTWGRIARQNLWPDLYDENELKRRVNEMAMRNGKVGKRVALAIRVNSIGPLDGYDIFDSIPVVIKRGAVDTSKYGSGLWTIMGVTWQLFPDGHDNLTLTVMPKEDGEPVASDLITSAVILTQSDWQVGYTGPDLVPSGKWYLDQSTGNVWRWDQDLQEWVLYTAGLGYIAIRDRDDPNRVLKIEGGVLMVSTDGGVTWTVAINPEGMDANGIVSGNLPGGSNLIPDGSFEMTPFPTIVRTNFVITTEGEWDLQYYYPDGAVESSGGLIRIQPWLCRA